MQVRVRLFAIAHQLAGESETVLELPEAATVGELRRQLAQQKPALQDILGFCAFAVSGEYADDTTKLSAQAEVACLPPVSGG